MYLGLCRMFRKSLYVECYMCLYGFKLSPSNSASQSKSIGPTLTSRQGWKKSDFFYLNQIFLIFFYNS